MMSFMMTVLVAMSALCVARAERLSIITSVTHTTHIHHRVVRTDTGVMSSIADEEDVRDNSLKTKQSRTGLEGKRKELCTDIPSLQLLQEASVIVPSSLTSSELSLHIMSYENSSSEEPPSCLVIDSVESSSSHRDLSECGQVVHHNWQSKKQKNDSDTLGTETLHFTFYVLDEDPDKVLPHWLGSSSGSSKVCVGWSHLEEELLSAGAGDVNLTLVQKLQYFSDPGDSSAIKKTPHAHSSYQNFTKEFNNFLVSSPSFYDSRDFAAAITNSQTTSNGSYISRTVSVNSLVDSATNISLCTLSLPDQHLSSSLNLTSEECNFRSAIETCNLFLSSDSCVDASSSSCVVMLPPMQTIVMDPVHGEMKITDDTLCGSLFVEGNGCVIHPSSSTSLSMRLLNVDLPVPSDRWFSLSINNITIANFGNSSVKGGAVRLNNFKSNYISSVTNVIFKNNSASDGGALAISNSENIVLGGNLFEGNTAQGDAGGLLIDSDCENINITVCSFSYNTAMGEVNSKPDIAGLGGGAMINSSNTLIFLTNCSFSNNIALRAGGLGVYDLNNNIFLTDVSFSNNKADRGGGIYAAFDNLYMSLTRCYFLGNKGNTDGGGLRLYRGNYYTTLLQCSFSGNSVGGEGGSVYGGGVYIGTDNEYFTCRDCHFSGNSVSSSEGGGAYGGGIYMFTANYYMVMQDCHFYDNSADTGGGLYLDAGNWDASFHNLTCRDNVARGDGGGLAIVSGNNDMTINDSSFTGNTAGTRGGGIYSAFQNNNFQLIRSDVTGNLAAASGGGVYIGESHERVRFDDVDISENVALETAGGAYLSRFSSEITLFACQIRYNTAETVGGLLALVDDMSISLSAFHHNTAQKDFGALYVQSSKYLEVTSSNFSHNIAEGVCGAISVGQMKSVTMKSSLFLSNSAGTGGAVCVTEGSRNTSFIDINFQNNVASLSAGALLVIDAVNVFLKFSSFYDNTALTRDGSAIYISSSSVFLESSEFSGNNSPLGGGTVFWVSSSGMQEPSGLTDSDAGNFFALNNTARYGSLYATEARYIVSMNDVSSLEVFDYSKQAAPPITVLIQDWYNQTVLSDSSSSVSVSVSTSLTSDCYREKGFIGGQTRLTLLNGSTTFDLLEPLCAPSYNLSLEVLSSLPSITSLPFQYSFRSCATGEYYAERICNPCKEGSYSLVDPSTLSLSDLNSDVCQMCPSGAQKCFEDQIILAEGHWRISEDSSRIFDCPLDKSSCLGGNLTGESSCGEGYSGALCAVCQDGYHYSDTYQTCEPCGNTKTVFDSFFVVIICFFTLFLVFLYLKAKSIIDRLQISNFNELVAYLMISLNCLNRNSYNKEKDKYIAVIQMLVNSLIYRFRIYFVLYQIVVALPFVLSTQISSTYNSIVSALNFINFSLTDSSVSSCSFGSNVDFIDKLFFQTLFPMVVLAVMFIFCGLHVAFQKKDLHLLSKHKSNKWNIKTRKIISKYYYVALFFIDLILPYTSAIIFSTFSCKNIDPDSNETGDDSFMTADYSVSCHSERYAFARSWATIMIFVYPIGVPACFAVILYRSRDDIEYRYTPLGDEEKETDRSIRLAAVSSLYEVYKPEFWYWEVFEIFYRLLLTGFLVLIGQGFSTQIFFGIFVAFVYVKCQEIFMPYEDRQLNIFKMITLWQIFYIFFIALVSFTEVSNTNDWRFETVVFLIIFGNIPLEFILGYVLPRLNSDPRMNKVLFRDTFQERSDAEYL